MTEIFFNKNKTQFIQYARNKISSNYDIPDGVREIGKYAFYDCDNLTSISIPNSVRIIASIAFYESDNLTDIYYNNTETQWRKINIYSVNDSLNGANIHYNAISSLDKGSHGIIFDTGNNEITVKTGEAISGASVIVALYSDGRLVGLKTQTKDLSEDGDNTFASPLTDFSCADTVKIMVWEDGDKIKSAFKACVLDLN